MWKVLIHFTSLLVLGLNLCYAQTYPPGPTPTLPVQTRIHLPVQAWPEGQVIRQATPPPDPATVGTNKGGYVWLKTGTDSLFAFSTGLWRPIKGGGGSTTIVQEGQGIDVTSSTVGATTTYTVAASPPITTQLINQSGTNTVITGVPNPVRLIVSRPGFIANSPGDYSWFWSSTGGGTLTIVWVRALDSENITVIIFLP